MSFFQRSNLNFHQNRFKFDFNASSNLLFFAVSTISLLSITYSLLRITGGNRGRSLQNSPHEQQDIVTHVLDETEDSTEKPSSVTNQKVEKENEVVLVSTTSETKLPRGENTKIEEPNETDESSLDATQDVENTTMTEDSIPSNNRAYQSEDPIVENKGIIAESNVENEEDSLANEKESKDETVSTAIDSTSTVESSPKLRSPESSLSIESDITMKETDFDQKNNDVQHLSISEQSGVVTKVAPKTKRRTIFKKWKKKPKA